MSNTEAGDQVDSPTVRRYKAIVFGPRQRLVRCGALLLLLACSCARVAEEDRAVATVDGQAITAGAFREAMAVRGGETPEVFASPANKDALLDELIRFEVLAARAEKDGILRDPDFVRTVKRMAIQRLEERALSQSKAELEVSDAEVEAYYREHAADYRLPERIHVAVVHVSVPAIVSPEKETELAARAETAREEALALPGATRNFGYVAAKYSDDQATRYKGGDAGWLTKGAGAYRWDEAVVAAVLALSEPGAISPVLEDGNGFYVFRLMERTPESTVELERVAGGIRMELARRKRTAVLERLYAESREACRVRVDQALLETVQPPGIRPSRPVGPPPLPGN